MNSQLTDLVVELKLNTAAYTITTAEKEFINHTIRLHLAAKAEQCGDDRFRFQTLEEAEKLIKQAEQLKYVIASRYYSTIALEVLKHFPLPD